MAHQLHFPKNVRHESLAHHAIKRTLNSNNNMTIRKNSAYLGTLKTLGVNKQLFEELFSNSQGLDDFISTFLAGLFSMNKVRFPLISVE